MLKLMAAWFFYIAVFLSLQDVSIEGHKLLKCDATKNVCVGVDILRQIPRGGAAAALNPFPSGYHPFGYGLTDLGKEFLSYDGSLESDVGRFLASLKTGKRKSAATMKEQWLEVVRVSKQGQSMRVYRKLDDLISFCLKAGFID